MSIVRLPAARTRRTRHRRRTALIALALVAAVLLSAAWFILADRRALRAVVAVCTTDMALLGSPLPCREVDEASGIAVLRASLHRRPHVIIVPLAAIVGIEDPALRAPGARDYFAIAWRLRTIIAADAGRPLAWNDYGLAINSRIGRSQDQLHIHLACVAGPVQRALGAAESIIPWDRFVDVPTRLHGQFYKAMHLHTLEGVNPVVLAMDKLGLQASDMDDLSLALIGRRFADGSEGFDLVADLDRPDRDYPAHAEFLLDPTCRS